ncbi:MAG: GTPase [Candidatus Pacearchaeota archaeon]
MPINASHEYYEAEREYHQAVSTKDKIEKLKKMISVAPAHKGAENLRAQLKSRLKKLKEEQQKEQKKKSSSDKKEAIRKADMQCVIVGTTNSGKSSLISLLTNQNPVSADYDFTTRKPVIGVMEHEGCQIQIIENPAFESEFYNKGLTNNTDTILMVVEDFEQISIIEEDLEKAQGKVIIVFNKTDKLDQKEKRKLEQTLKSKYNRYHNFQTISIKTKEGIEELKEKIFQSFDKIRIYTKEPGEEPSPKPMMMEPESTIGEAAEKILTGFSKNIKEAKITGPSSKFPQQRVGLKHKLKDKDVIEFKTR